MNKIVKFLFISIFFIITGCKVTKKNSLSNLDKLLDKQIEFYKGQNLWTSYLQQKHHKNKKSLDSIFCKHNLTKLTDFIIIEEIVSDIKSSFRIISNEEELFFFVENNEWIMGDIDFYDEKKTFELYTGESYIGFIENISQNKLDECSELFPIYINNSIIIYSHYKNGEIINKRYVSCDYIKAKLLGNDF